MAESPPPEISRDAIHGLGVTLRQYRAGHRVGVDAVLLAAAAGPPVGRLVDVGAGVGSVGLALIARWPQARGDLVEIAPEIAALARANADDNGLSARTRVIVADALSAPSRRAGGLVDGEADLVVTNPPFYAAGEVRRSPDAARARAHVFDAADNDPLAAWIVASLALLRPGGRFVAIHRADALGAILAAFGRRLGAVAVLPVHPRPGADAIRVLVSGVKGSKAPLCLKPGLVLHEPDGRFSERAGAIHRGEARLDEL